jgi:hypothetical protein
MDVVHSLDIESVTTLDFLRCLVARAKHRTGVEMG